MLELYLLLGSLIFIGVIVYRRHFITEKTRKVKFKEEVHEKLVEIKKETFESAPERFREKHQEEQKKLRFNLAEYKEQIRRAEVMMARKDWIQAKKYLIGALALAKDELQASLMLAQVYFESGDIKKAEALYRRLMEMTPNSADVHAAMAKIHLKQKRYKEAVHEYVVAVEMDDKDDQKWVSLGKLYMLLMRYSVAGECFKRAAELKPREVSYLMMLAESCEGDLDFENALRAYERILTLEPYNEKAQEKAQDVRIKLNEMEKSITASKVS